MLYFSSLLCFNKSYNFLCFNNFYNYKNKYISYNKFKLKKKQLQKKQQSLKKKLKKPSFEKVILFQYYEPVNFTFFFIFYSYFFFKFNNILLKSGFKLKSFYFFIKFLNLYFTCLFYGSFHLYFNMIQKLINFPLKFVTKQSKIIVRNNTIFFSKIKSLKILVSLLNLNNKKKSFFFNILFEFFQLMFKQSTFISTKESILKNVFKHYVRKRKRINLS
jgi:hypothetical protein